MNFKYSAFTENTPEAREWLEKLGYKKVYLNGSFEEPEFDYVGIDILFTVPEYGHYAISRIFNPVETKFIDCRSNLPLFKSVTAVRDDSDYMQWFIDPCGYWHFNPIYMDGMRKATLDELINKFK